MNGQPKGDPACPSTNQKLFVQLQSGTADPNVPYGGVCLASHCLASFSATLDFWRRHLGCTAASTTTMFGSPQPANRKQTFTQCAFGVTYGVEGVKINAAAEFKPALDRAIQSGKPFVIDVVMQNEPVPTAGHWNIMDIYSPGKKVHHVAVDGAVHA